ncbi:MAG: hypothetical protein OEV42_05410 [Deltaproteobacteria bacterium]|nr:hypothetical protein [Deltaproteobacteria bacterium]
MMKCDDFKKYLSGKGAVEGPPQEVEDHLSQCEYCSAMMNADRKLEEIIADGLKKSPLPEGLLNRIDQDISALEAKEKDEKPFFPWKIAMPALAMAVLLLVMLNPFIGDIGSPEKLVHFAMENHYKNYAMTFEAGQVSDIPGWFVGKLAFEVSVPGLFDEGLQLLGGRKCSLGREDVAYLFYEEEGKRASLFILDPHSITFDMKKNTAYKMPVYGDDVTFWSDDSLLYVLVKSGH